MSPPATYIRAGSRARRAGSFATSHLGRCPSGGLRPLKFDPVEFVFARARTILPGAELDVRQYARKGPRQGRCGSKEPKKARLPPFGHAPPLRRHSSPTALGRLKRDGASKGVRRSNAPYGARRSHRGLAKEAVQPRRRASVEERPKSSPKGCGKDSARAQPGQGRPVCAPPEAD